MERNGAIKVDEYLRVEGEEDIYAIGDCCNSPNIKLAYAAAEQAKLLISNIQARLSGKKQKPWKPGDCKSNKRIKMPFCDFRLLLYCIVLIYLKKTRSSTQPTKF